MENIDFTNFQVPDILKLQSIIGKEKEITYKLISYLKSNAPISPEILPICTLLLIENRSSTIEVIQNILIHHPHLVQDTINELQSSKFYNQRCAVPQIIIEIPDTKMYLKKAFNDNIGVVVKEACLSLQFYEALPFSDNELLDIALALNNHQYDYIQCLVPDVLIFIKQKTFLMSEISLSKSWRKRLSLVKKVSYLSLEDRYYLYNTLCKDPEESVRIALVKEIDCLTDFKKYAEIFLTDTSENVRSLMVRKIGNMYDDLLDNIVNDPSWIVRKELLCIHREDIYERISLPIINSLPKNNTWRVKIEILETISHILNFNDVLVQRCLLDILFKYLTDPVYEVRNRAGGVLKDLINKAEWSIELQERLECLLQSSYLVRITLVEAFKEFDKKHGTKFIKNLLNDKVINVRIKVLSILSKEDLDDEIKEIIKNMECSDMYMKEEIERLLNF